MKAPACPNIASCLAANCFGPAQDKLSSQVLINVKLGNYNPWLTVDIKPNISPP